MSSLFISPIQEVTLPSGRVTDYRIQVLTATGVQDAVYATLAQAKTGRRALAREPDAYKVPTMRLFTALLTTFVHPGA